MAAFSDWLELHFVACFVCLIRTSAYGHRPPPCMSLRAWPARAHQAAKLVAALLRVARVTACRRKVMAAYRRVYDSHHVQADCKESGSAPEPYARQSSTGYLFNMITVSIGVVDRVTSGRRERVRAVMSGCLHPFTIRTDVILSPTHDRISSSISSSRDVCRCPSTTPTARRDRSS